VTGTLETWRPRQDETLGREVLLAAWTADLLAHLDWISSGADVAVTAITTGPPNRNPE
jgi:hypothetical protein